MALKNKIDKATFDALPDLLKAEYKLVGDNYMLETDEAVEAIAARNREKERADALKAQLDAANATAAEQAAAAAAAIEEAARKKGDITTLEASWQAKLETAKATSDAALASVQAVVNKLLIDNKANEIANEISISPSLILPHIKARLAAEMVDGAAGEAITRVLDKNGKPSAATLEELKKEFVANAEFAAIIKGTKASGGGAHQNSNGGGADKKISQMSETELVALHKEIGSDAYNARLASERAAA